MWNRCPLAIKYTLLKISEISVILTNDYIILIKLIYDSFLSVKLEDQVIKKILKSYWYKQQYPLGYGIDILVSECHKSRPVKKVKKNQIPGSALKSRIM